VRARRCDAGPARPAANAPSAVARDSRLAGGARLPLGPGFLLELADRDTQRRLGHVQPFRGAAEVQLLGDGDEVAEVAKLGHAGGRYPAIDAQWVMSAYLLSFGGLLLLGGRSAGSPPRLP
jgi:hypothetical protein